MKNNYAMYHFQIQQPFFSFNVNAYHEKQVFEPYCTLFYEFSTSQIIDRSLNDALFMTCIPDGCIDIIFIRHHQSYKIEFIGSPISSKQLIVFPNASYFGIRLMPGMFFPSCATNIKEVCNTETFLPHISSELEAFVDTLFQADSLDARISLFFLHLLQYSADNYTVNETIQNILYLISLSKGTLEISSIAKKICYSERHLTRIFSDAMGYSPKMFCRITRFQCALHAMIERKSDSISGFISVLNYADQAHFQREFKEFTGLTPGHFIQSYANTASSYIHSS